MGLSCSVLTPCGDLWDWADGEDGNVSNLLTSILEVSAGEVWGDLADVGQDGAVVLENVGGDNFQELGWVLEDLSPLLDSIEVTLNAGAVLEVGWDIGDDLTELSNSLKDILEVLLLNVSDDSGDLVSKSWHVGKALLDFREVLLSGETEDESVHEHDDIGWGDHWLGLVFEEHLSFQ